MGMNEVTMRFDRERIMQQVLALSALRAVERGSVDSMLGGDDDPSLAVMAGVAVGRVAVALRGYAVDYDAQELTLTLRVPSGADVQRLFKLAEGAVAARLADRDAEAERLERAALLRLGGNGGVGGLRLTPHLA